jgi:hypothetical protein
VATTTNRSAGKPISFRLDAIWFILVKAHNPLPVSGAFLSRKFRLTPVFIVLSLFSSLGLPSSSSHHIAERGEYELLCHATPSIWNFGCSYAIGFLGFEIDLTMRV